MGETMAETIRDQIEIEKPIASEAGFKESISFGRFENDLLSWERWSSFSQNKYLEEVGKCSTPGSVAKKKAYFEAHYKKIAARKAEMIDQEQEMGDDSFRSDTPSNGYPITNGCSTKLEFDSLPVDGVTRSMEPDNSPMAGASANQTEEPSQDAVGVSCQDLLVENVREEVDDLPNSPKSNQFEGAVLIEDENRDIETHGHLDEMFELIIEDNSVIVLPAKSEQVVVAVQEGKDLNGSQDPLEQSHQLDNKTSHDQENKTEDVISKPRKEPQKRTPASKDKKLVKAKKTPVAPTTKTTHTSLPRASKPAPASPVVSASKISTRKESSPSLLKKSSPSSVKKKTSTPSSIHMSLNLETTKSDLATPATTRRSLIMEKMGDKEIVKRAFRAFQNNFSLSNSKPSIEEKSSIPQQVSTKRTARVASTLTTPQKDKERVKKVGENTSSQRRQVGERENSVSTSRPVKGAGQHQTSAKTSPSSAGLKSDERTEKRKELSKKLAKSDVELERPRLLSQSKEKKEAEVKKLSQSLNFKATPMPNFHRGERASKTRGTRVAASDESYHQPDPHR